MKPKQTELVIRHLQDYGSISALIALQEYDIMRLASRIRDLRKRGYDIVTEKKTRKNRYGETVRYAVYRFEEETE